MPGSLGLFVDVMEHEYLLLCQSSLGILSVIFFEDDFAVGHFRSAIL